MIKLRPIPARVNCNKDSVDIVTTSMDYGESVGFRVINRNRGETYQCQSPIRCSSKTLLTTKNVPRRRGHFVVPVELTQQAPFPIREIHDSFVWNANTHHWAEELFIGNNSDVANKAPCFVAGILGDPGVLPPHATVVVQGVFGDD